jgi:predicted hydrolase (HD superfamily)
VGKDDGIKLLVHVRSVIRVTTAMADSIRHYHGVAVDHDRLLTAAILHDVDKVLLYSATGVKSAMYRELPHTLYTAHKMLKHGFDHELVNMVISHSENHCTKKPTTVEAMILKHGDHGESEAVRIAVDVLSKAQ